MDKRLSKLTQIVVVAVGACAFYGALTLISHDSPSGASQFAQFSPRDMLDDAQHPRSTRSLALPAHRLRCSGLHLGRIVLSRGGFREKCRLIGVMRPPPEPHPDLRDGPLKDALQKDWHARHTQLGYLKARDHLWGEVDGNGRRAVGVYTGEAIDYFKQPLPNKGAVEHAWPLTRLPKEARSDLHHMFAATGGARMVRLNLHYGKVRVPIWSRGGSRAGAGSRIKPVFEVRKQRRGDIARAVFYVATMYDLSVGDAEEKILRKWHRADRVDRAERRRNKRIAGLQGDRNPFVDHPKLSRRISDF